MAYDRARPISIYTRHRFSSSNDSWLEELFSLLVSQRTSLVFVPLLLRIAIFYGLSLRVLDLRDFHWKRIERRSCWCWVEIVNYVHYSGTPFIRICQGTNSLCNCSSYNTSSPISPTNYYFSFTQWELAFWYVNSSSKSSINH